MDVLARRFRRVAPFLILAVAVAVVMGVVLTRKAATPAQDLSSSLVVQEGALEATLSEVVDGDTIWVALADGSKEKVRYIGIDAPELAHDGSPAEYLGEEATAHNATLLAEGPLRLELDVDDRDDFGRLLAYVWAGEILVNERMVADGYAVAHNYPPNLAMQDRLWAAHDAARDAGLGIWAEH